MISGIDLNEVMDFVSENDKDETKTTFKISPISSRIQARIGALIGSGGAGALEGMLESFKFGVKGIINLIDKKGNPVHVELESYSVGAERYSVVPEKVLAMLPLSIISEVGAKVISISQLSEGERKN